MKIYYYYYPGISFQLVVRNLFSFQTLISQKEINEWETGQSTTNNLNLGEKTLRFAFFMQMLLLCLQYKEINQGKGVF